MGPVAGPTARQLPSPIDLGSCGLLLPLGSMTVSGRSPTYGSANRYSRAAVPANSCAFSPADAPRTSRLQAFQNTP